MILAIDNIMIISNFLLILLLLLLMIITFDRIIVSTQSVGFHTGY